MKEKEELKKEELKKEELKKEIDVTTSVNDNEESSDDKERKKLFICSIATFYVLLCISGLLSVKIITEVCYFYMLLCIIGMVIAAFIYYKKLFYSVITVIILAVIGWYIYYSIQASSQATIAKPIIYLYPERTEEVNIMLDNPGSLTCTYPKYDENTGWNVTAEPSGDLTYQDGRKLYALYWEGKSKNTKSIHDDGFVVKGEDTTEFLEEKLALLGLNEREAEEFIVYWLPQMKTNKYNYIRFETMEEIENNMPLNITPKPDTTIRVMMDWCEIESEKEADKLKENIKEQKLNTPERTGFTAVEWGGSNIK